MALKKPLKISYFYPRPPRGGRRPVRVGDLSNIEISIHALREEGDILSQSMLPCHRDFYPRPPRGGRPQIEEMNDADPAFLSTPSARRATPPFQCEAIDLVFLSTPSARRATLISRIIVLLAQFLSTPSARRATRNGRRCREVDNISIHALREEGDLPWVRMRWLTKISIHALREEGDRVHIHQPEEKSISIHALREEGDFHWCAGGVHGIHFYPRPPRGGRRQTVSFIIRQANISIHALREEGDLLRFTFPLVEATYFYPRPPRGGRRCSACVCTRANCISIHALREEGDNSALRSCRPLQTFLSTPSARRAT